jgi:hypothetical protein
MNCGLEIMDMRTGILHEKKFAFQKKNVHAWFVQTALFSKTFTPISKICLVFPLSNFFRNIMNLFFIPQKCITFKKKNRNSYIVVT